MILRRVELESGFPHPGSISAVSFPFVVAPCEARFLLGCHPERSRGILNIRNNVCCPV
jgi:hypothetical protein